MTPRPVLTTGGPFAAPASALTRTPASRVLFPADRDHGEVGLACRGHGITIGSGV